MGFDYDKIKRKQESDQQWSSYSDLFMALSVIFLLMYVTTSIRGGTVGIDKVKEVQDLRQTIAKQEAQLQAFRSLKDEYLESGASAQEQAMYDELMDKLHLLRDEAKQEKEDLRRKASENEAKEKALNQYQQLVASIVNANMVAQSRIKKRDDTIKSQKEEIEEKQAEVSKLEKMVEARRREVQKNEERIAGIQQELSAKMEQLESARKLKQISEKRMQSQLKKLKETAQTQISELETKKKTAEQQIQSMNQQLGQVTQTLQEQSKKAQALESKLASANEEFEKRSKQLQEKFEQERAQERAQLESEIEKQKLTAIAQARRRAEFEQKMAQKKQEMQSEIENLNQQMASQQEKLQGTQKELEKARSLANARKELAKQISKNFQAAGIKASVDANTGDVTIDFGDNYFSTGSANLKPEMRQIIEKTMPIYSQSILGDKKIASRVKAVEIVGYASPTFKGKYVDPKSLDPEDRKAAEYNMDLSFKRAKSIYNHVFDKDKMQFELQKDLLPLLKVSGRSFFEEANRKDRDVASGMDQATFCKMYDCKKAQRVIIRFDLGN